MVTCEVSQCAEQGGIIDIHDGGKFGTSHL